MAGYKTRGRSGGRSTRGKNRKPAIALARRTTEKVASLTDVPNIRQRGTRPGNWLTKEQLRELLAVPNRSTVKGKRDHAILALLVGCALRPRELASLTGQDLQMRENRWVIAELRGKSGRVRTVAVPLRVKHGIDAWQATGEVEDGPLLRSISEGGEGWREPERLGDMSGCHRSSEGDWS